MTQTDFLAVFCYDVESDKRRRKIAKVLEAHAVRVQKSVFEAWMNPRKIKAVSRESAALLGPRDSLRVYAIGANGYKRTQVFGATVLIGPEDYYLV